jgi:FlaA1/EpsC-like NDP-sugar epimerase
VLSWVVKISKHTHNSPFIIITFAVMNLIAQGKTPRWVILVVDLLLSSVALGIAYLVRFDFSSPNKAELIQEWQILKPALPIYLLVRFLLYFFTHTHTGIIRYTSTQDAKRVFLAVMGGSLIFVLLSVVRFYWYDGFFFLPKSILVVEFLFAFGLLMSMRTAIKLIYLEQLKSRGATQNVIIYGAGEMGIHTKRTLEHDHTTLYNVIGFVDDAPNLQGKMIEGIPVKNVDYISKWAEKKEIETVIIAIKEISNARKRKVVELCLELDINVLTVPPLEQWMNGDFTSKQIKRVKLEDLLGRKEILLNTENINRYAYNKVILVTGAAGSIGSELVRQLLNFNPKKVILLDQAESPLYDLNVELTAVRKQVNWEVVIADITNEQRMRKVFDHFCPSVVFHAAAYKHVPLMEDNPSEAILTNVKGSKIIADLCDEFNVERMVMISTDKAVNPTNVMGASKRIAEIYVQSLNKNSSTNFITTRFGNVLGSNGSVIPLFRKQIENGGPVTVTDERITRYFMTIPEACQLVLEAASMGKGGEIFVFDMGESMKIIDVAKKMIKLSGLELGKDIDIKITGLRPGEKLYEELLTESEKSIPTHHEKIMIGVTQEYAYHEFAPKVIDLIESFQSQDNLLIVNKMKQLVPEFISNNSEFSKLD